MVATLRRLFQESPLILKLFASMVLPSLLSVVVVTTILSSLFSARAREDLDRINALRLQGIDAQMEAVVSSSFRLTYLLATNRDLMGTLAGLSKDPIAYSQATTQINQFLLASPYVDSLVLASSNRIVYSLHMRDTYRESRDQMLAVLRAAGTAEPRLRPVVRSTGQVGRVLTFVSNDAAGTDTIDSAAAVNLNLELLMKDLFGSIDTATAGDRTSAILDRSGGLLVDSRWVADAGPDLTPADRQRIASDPRSSGTLQTQAGHRRLIASFVRSAVQGFTVVTVVDHDSYMSGIDGLGWQTLMWSALVLTLLLGGALVIVNRLYRPLDSLYRRVQRLDRAPEPPGTVHDLAYATAVLDRTAVQLDSRTGPDAVGRVLLGADPAAAHTLAEAGLPVASAYFVAVARADAAVPARWDEVAALARGPVGGLTPCLALAWLDAEAVVVGVVPPEGVAGLASGLATWAQSVRAELRVSVSVGVSSPEPAGRLSEAYALAQAQLRARVWEGPGSVAVALGTEFVDGEVDVPRWATRFEQVTAAGDRERAVALIGELLGAASGPVVSRLELVLAAAEAMQRVAGRVAGARAVADRAALQRELDGCRGTEDIARWLTAVYEKARVSLDRVGTVRASDLVTEATAYLEAHFADPLLSAALVAEQLRISPQYFSRIFNDQTGNSFPDHLKRLRLERARGLLEEGVLSLDEVCAQAGFGNKTYFTTAFKQRFGVTPGRLKTSHRRQAGAG